VVHANAPLSPLGRWRLVRCVLEEGWPVARGRLVRGSSNEPRGYCIGG
jgi:hypothetical protein